MLKRPSWIPRPLSTYHPWLHRFVVWFRQLERRWEWKWDDHVYAAQKEKQNLATRIKKHQSVLVRRLGGDDLTLQLNKVDNLKIVIQQLDGILIRPGETFSFCKLVGKPTLRKGFKEGMELSRGVAQAGVGGGICQASNLIYWLVLHSPLEVIERHHHSFDPFPDKGRILPFASGATVMYNYRDLRFRNNSSQTFQFRFWLDKKCLNGDLRCNQQLDYSYHVFESEHRFTQVEGKYYRSNQLWRQVIDKKKARVVRQEFLVKNHAEVKYVPSLEITSEP